MGDDVVCTFFGHRDATGNIEKCLETVLIDLIENKNVNVFYVGNNGNFDFMVRKMLQKLKEKYSHINYFIVLAYLPLGDLNQEFNNSIFPEGLENVPPKYAIDKRNRWMIEKSDYVIAYVKYDFGGAAKFKMIAEKKGKKVLNLAFK